MECGKMVQNKGKNPVGRLEKIAIGRIKGVGEACGNFQQRASAHIEESRLAPKKPRLENCVPLPLARKNATGKKRETPRGILIFPSKLVKPSSSQTAHSVEKTNSLAKFSLCKLQFCESLFFFFFFNFPSFIAKEGGERLTLWLYSVKYVLTLQSAPPPSMQFRVLQIFPPVFSLLHGSDLSTMRITKIECFLLIPAFPSLHFNSSIFHSEQLESPPRRLLIRNNSIMKIQGFS